MRSWGSSPSTVQPTDWAVPRTSRTVPDLVFVLVHLVLVLMCNNRQVHFKKLISILINMMMSTREVLSEGLGADDAGGVVDVLHRDVSVVPDVLHL